MHEDVNLIALVHMTAGSVVVVMSSVLIHAIKYVEMESLRLMKSVRTMIQHQHLVMDVLMFVYLRLNGIVKLSMTFQQHHMTLQHVMAYVVMVK